MIPTNGIAQPAAPTEFTMTVFAIALWGTTGESRSGYDLINGANNLARPLNLQYPFCRFTGLRYLVCHHDLTPWAGNGEFLI